MPNGNELNIIFISIRRCEARSWRLQAAGFNCLHKPELIKPDCRGNQKLFLLLLQQKAGLKSSIKH